MRSYLKFLVPASAALLSVFLFSSIQAQDDDGSAQLSGTGEMNGASATAADVPVSAPQESTVTTTTLAPSADGTSVTKTVDTHKTVVTTIPVPNSTADAPAGYVSCATVEAGWHGDAWIPSHKICTYSNATEGVAWVQGYWKCNKVTSDGMCVIWEWRDGQWSKTVPVY